MSVVAYRNSLQELDDSIAAARQGEQIDIAEFLKRRAAGRFNVWQEPTGYKLLSDVQGWVRPLPRAELLGVLFEKDHNTDELPPGIFGAMQMRPDTRDGFTRSLWTVSERDWNRMSRDAYFGTYEMACNVRGTYRFSIHRWQQPGTPRPDFSKGGA